MEAKCELSLDMKKRSRFSVWLADGKSKWKKQSPKLESNQNGDRSEVNSEKVKVNTDFERNGQKWK